MYQIDTSDDGSIMTQEKSYFVVNLTLEKYAPVSIDTFQSIFVLL